METRSLGLLIVGVGLAIAFLGGLIYFGGLSWFGRLPGDIRYESDNTRVFIPITSMILASALLTLVINLLRRLF